MNHTVEAKHLDTDNRGQARARVLIDGVWYMGISDKAGRIDISERISRRWVSIGTRYPDGYANLGAVFCPAVPVIAEMML